MPQRALHPCRKPGCPNTHRNAGGYCDAHASLSRTQRMQTPDQRRYYSSGHWQRTRAAVLRTEPLCRECAKQGRTTAATNVDHIDGDWRHEDRANLQPLCSACERSKTGRQHALKHPPRSFSGGLSDRPAVSLRKRFAGSATGENP